MVWDVFLEDLDDLDGSDCLGALDGGLMTGSLVWEGARSITVSGIRCTISAQIIRTERCVTRSDWLEGGMTEGIVC